MYVRQNVETVFIQSHFSLFCTTHGCESLTRLFVYFFHTLYMPCEIDSSVGIVTTLRVGR
jgi:hypothetical protein